MEKLIEAGNAMEAVLDSLITEFHANPLNPNVAFIVNQADRAWTGWRKTRDRLEKVEGDTYVGIYEDRRLVHVVKFPDRIRAIQIAMGAVDMTVEKRLDWTDCEGIVVAGKWTVEEFEFLTESVKLMEGSEEGQIIFDDVTKMLFAMKEHAEVHVAKKPYIAADCMAHKQQVGFTCVTCFSRYCISLGSIVGFGNRKDDPEDPWNEIVELLKTAAGRATLAANLVEKMEGIEDEGEESVQLSVPPAPGRSG